MTASAAPPKPRAAERWHEILRADGSPRPRYAELLAHLQELPRAVLRTLEEQMAATLREMGVNFDATRGNEPWGRLPWTCDLLPHVFDGAEWQTIVSGFRQRLRAWEALIADVYGDRAILRAGVVPVQAVLGSPNYQAASVGVPRARGAYFHLSGICLARDRRGVLQVKNHQFAHATGISYMMQNRRALARVAPELFAEAAVQSVAETSVLIAEQLREAAEHCADEPRVALLAPAGTTAASAEQSFLARRMGVPIVQGGDLVVLDDCVFLKTVRGLERVDVIYNCVPDPWLDPLVFRRDSLLGAPGLVHCLRKGRVAVVNGVGSQLADDASLLPFAPQIIRFYLSETPVLPSVPTLWLGDLDQRELALAHLDEWHVRPMTRERALGPWDGADFKDEEALRAEVRRQPQLYIAQPRETGAQTFCFEDGKAGEYPQDHVVFAVRTGKDFDVLPGALTRVDTRGERRGSEWTSKDTWVLADAVTEPLLPRFTRRVSGSEAHVLPRRQVTSRVADAFYWMGRYLERAYHQAYLISVIETLETEELNSAERKHYQPVWNRLLPPLEKSAGTSRRSIANRLDRYRLVLLPEPGSVLRTYQRALSNAESVPESISPEAWTTLNDLRTRFARTRYRANTSETNAVRATRRLAEAATQLIPQFFAIASNTMLADDGWRFCEVGQMLERAVITANSVVSLSGALVRRDAPPASTALHATEIELSAFLRLLGTRDAYRRIYQMRAEPVAVLELLWQQPEVPRSVRRCLERCRDLLRQSIAPEAQGGARAPEAIDELIHRIMRIDWARLTPSLPAPAENGVENPTAHRPEGAPEPGLEPLLRELHSATLDLHGVIADSFLNHQAHITQLSTPRLQGL